MHYDEQEIPKLIKAFCERVQESPTLKMYFDADNTLYKFSTYNRIYDSLSMMHTKGFYKNLPVFIEAPDVVSGLQRMGIEVYVISNTIESPWCESEKMESLNYHFPMIPKSNILLLPPESRKTDYVDDVEHSILVDDYHVNINQWFDAGGLGIKKSYSGKKRVVPVICSLIDLFPVLYELNLIRR